MDGSFARETATISFFCMGGRRYASAVKTNAVKEVATPAPASARSAPIADIASETQLKISAQSLIMYAVGENSSQIARDAAVLSGRRDRIRFETP